MFSTVYGSTKVVAVYKTEFSASRKGVLLQYATLAKQSEHGDFSGAYVVHRSANRQFLLFHKVSQYG
jgi:hypothetical protein